MNMEEALKSLVKVGGSDLHLKAGLPLMIRQKGELLPTDMPPLPAEEIERMLFSLISEKQKEKLENERELDFSYNIEGVARFRGNIFFQKGMVGGVFRVIPAEIPTLESLGMPETLKKLVENEQGLILLTGPTGSGKSTTLAAMLDVINSTKRRHIITIEDPIEFVHRDKKCVLNQREVGFDTLSFAQALKRALRQDPDIILVGEMRDPETITIAMTAAETGHLVLSTLHTNDAKQSVDRIINSFPPEEHHQIRMKLSLCLLAVISQRLVKKADGSGRVAAQEIMINSPTVSKLIEEGNIGKIDKVIEDSVTYYNMQSLNQSLFNLCKQKIVNEKDALSTSNNPNDLNLKIKTASYAGAAQGKSNIPTGGAVPNVRK